MKDFRFYQEYESTKRKVPTGNCIAVYLPTETESLMFTGGVEGYTGVYNEPDSPCCFGGVSLEYIRTKCKRVSEKQARTIHPKLFRRIEEGW